ncbi:MAG TPA: aspartate aminotransferase family protein, partial [Thermoanaerobaculia bacterium]|nr:aspartate aminotransferase family protein [Thermoanaerobaculia bacterium]
MSKPIFDDAVLRRAYDHAAGFLQSLPDRPVKATGTRAELMQILDVPLPSSGDAPAAVVDALAAAGEKGAVASAGPRYFG